MWISSVAYTCLSHFFTLALNFLPDPEWSTFRLAMPSPSTSTAKAQGIIRSFISRLSYIPPQSHLPNLSALQVSLQEYVTSYKLDKHLTFDHMHKMCMHAAAMAEVSLLVLGRRSPSES